MKYIVEKLKLLSVGVMALSFLMAVTLSSCGTGGSEAEEDDTEIVEEAEEAGDEHPAGEHPTSSDEHPADSSSEGGEHPSDTTSVE